MPAPRTRLKLEELLLRHGVIDQEQLERAREEQKTLGGDLGRILVDLGYITDELLCRAQSHQLGIPRASPETLSIAPELLQVIPVQVCESLGIIAVGRDRRSNDLQVATNDPANPEHLRAIAAAVGEKIEPVVATAQSIEAAIRRHYYGQPLKQTAPAEEKDPFARPAEAASDPQFAALLARLERIEQESAQRDEQILRVLRAIGDILVEKGIVSREEYLRRARGQ